MSHIVFEIRSLTPEFFARDTPCKKICRTVRNSIENLMAALLHIDITLIIIAIDVRNLRIRKDFTGYPAYIIHFNTKEISL